MGRTKKIRKEDLAESFCFECKDGGLLRVCDYKDCLKAYHPECVIEDMDKHEDFMTSEVPWSCSWHSCLVCGKTSKFQCFCCSIAVCGQCLWTTEFAVIRGDKGLSSHCLTLAGLLEGVKDQEVMKQQIDFNAQGTYESMFKCYWEMTKTKENLTREHVDYAVKLLVAGKNYEEPYDLNSICEEDQNIGNFEGEDELFSDDCDLNGTTYTRKRKKKKPGTWQRTIKSKGKEFIGWGSKALFDFLSTIGKDTSQELSQRDVAAIVTTYCNKHNLFHPEKKKKVLCDLKLQSLLGRKSVNKNSIHNLLSAHFAENLEQSEDDDEDEDDAECDSIEKSQNVSMASKMEQKLSSDRKSQTKKAVPKLQPSHFASMVVENIKLVYLKRSVVEELLRQQDTFEEKIIGSFVRVKSDPYDYLQRNSHQLLQVTGLKRTSPDGHSSTGILLQASNSPKDIAVCKLSNDDFSKEECENLHRKIMDGLLQKPTVVELEKKAKVLHEAITKHWISRELVRLQNLINLANEKGWRRELSDYMERMHELQTPDEQSRLLNEVPKVIADNAEELAQSDPSMMEEQEEEDHIFLPEPNNRVRRPQGLSSQRDRGTCGVEPAFGNIGSDFASEDYQSRNISTGHTKESRKEKRQRSDRSTSQELHQQPISPFPHNEDNSSTHGENPEYDQESMQSDHRTSDGKLPSGQHPTIPQSKLNDFQGQSEAVDSENNKLKEQPLLKFEFIVLSDDEDTNASTAMSRKRSKMLNQSIWYCASSHGLVRGPFSMSVLKEWSDTSPYELDFKVWRTGQSQEEATSLADAIRQVCS